MQMDLARWVGMHGWMVERDGWAHQLLRYCELCVPESTAACGSAGYPVID
jgi:hypothetical protein